MKNLKWLLTDNQQLYYIEQSDIEANSVLTTKQFDLDIVANILVSERYEKDELRELVYYLLRERNNLKEELKLWENGTKDHFKTIDEAANYFRDYSEARDLCRLGCIIIEEGGCVKWKPKEEYEYGDL